MIDLVAMDGTLRRRGGKAPDASARNLDHLCPRIEGFEEVMIVAHLAGYGLAPHGPASRNFGAEGEGLSLYLDDPDGNILELKGPAS